MFLHSPWLWKGGEVLVFPSGFHFSFAASCWLSHKGFQKYIALNAVVFFHTVLNRKGEWQMLKV